MPRFDLKRPCLHCPFRTDSTGIRFANRERALEIWASAFFHGFPCHKTAVYVEEDPEGPEDSGYYMGEATQHCAGFAIMQLKAHGGWAWPGIVDDQALADALAALVNMDAPVFDDLGEFLAANG